MGNPETLPDQEYHVQLTVHNPELAKKLAEVDENTLADLLHIPREPQNDSKWAKLAAKRMKEVQNQTPEFKKAWKKFRKDVTECHEDLLFKHDMED
ncbi:hypothetical protein HON22_01265 [Candidatus Peregrinibacteria bacterium]|jgi:hypothetical protein|nr:hypothetical protein [Candidatus Peregrinibacteria bacterium]